MQTLKILNSGFITHDVKRFILEKPKGFVYRPGQSAHISINLPGWEDKIRPFTFTSLNDWPYLEFIIKIHDDHNGVTNELGKLKLGSELLLHDVFGSIEYKGPGIFIAGGTGITPFIAIFRALYISDNLRKIGLIYSNRTKEDIILGQELFKMLGPAYINIFTREGVIGFWERRIDRKYLIETIRNFDTRFYVCGPQKFTEDITKDLINLGVNPQSLIV
ncbi:MAG TPA: FAD-binding oxidoreductase [Niabella sp.]|nr:FAD-binding oxidoreductase [Niabella sp.]HRO84722.1 FAD-binding oxidoreductase [Niabella sp.]HUN03988.1 FAD-binding oxidoreductase [Niabella sp.]